MPFHLDSVPDPPRGAPGGQGEESGPGTPPALAADQPLKAPAGPPAPERDPWLLALARPPQRGRAPAPAARAGRERCFQPWCHWGRASPATTRARVSTSWGPTRLPHAVHGPLCLARLRHDPPVQQQGSTAARCGEPLGGASLSTCTAPSRTDSLLKRPVAWLTEDCRSNKQLPLTKAEP